MMIRDELEALAHRETLAALIVERLNEARTSVTAQWQRYQIQHFVVDELLPPSLANALFAEFPAPSHMRLVRGLRQNTYVTNHLRSHLEEIVRAFQDPSVLDALSEVVGATQLLPDANLSASGISLMTRGGFQNPHIEPSHDEFRQNYRVLTANYHLTPDWRLSDGGHLELWHDGLSSYPTTTLAKFNRLIVIATHRASWHSISPVDSRRSRCCIFNCYYSPESLVREEYDHLDVFRGRPEQWIRDLWLRGEQNARQFWRKTLSPRSGD